MSDRKRIMADLAAAQNEQTQWRAHWMELADNVKPRGGRFFAADRANDGAKKGQKIINSTPTWAARTLAAGMMAGITSPSRPWFRLITQDASISESGGVKEWLSKVEDAVRLAFARSNLYNGLHVCYSMLGLFGVAVLHVDEDSEDTLRAYTPPIGQFYLSASDRGAVDTYFRTFAMTARQLVQKFGLEKCSSAVQTAFKGPGTASQWFDVVHCIEPNPDIKPGAKLTPESKPFLSWWFEAAGGDADPPLRKSGYDEMPFMAPRWDVTGESVYGDSPGMDVLGDSKALQVLESRKSMLIDKLANPPLRAPSALMNRVTSLLPGSVTYLDAVSTQSTIAPIFEVNPAGVNVVEMAIREHENRIKTGFYADLWLMLSQADGTMTAREVVERREEKLLQLGTVLERLQDELLDPLIERVFGILMRTGQIPKPPKELQGKEMRVEYISIMAQAQKLLGTTAVERLTAFVSQAAAVNPTVLDKLDFDQTIDEYGTMLGVPPVIIRPDDKVEVLRAQRAKQAAQQQAAAQAQQAAEVAKTASETDTEGDNALTSMLRGYGAA
jgi:hypothetical protein